jgi:hypothetical protein
LSTHTGEIKIYILIENFEIFWHSNILTVVDAVVSVGLVVDTVVPVVLEVVDCVVTVESEVGASLDVAAAAIATIDRNIRIIDIDFIVELCFVNLPFKTK